MDTDVLVVGGGPAGRALAGACARAGLRTALLDPAPGRPWPATYGCWAAELPAGLPPVGGRGPRRRDRRRGRGPPLGWEYAVLDVPALRAHLDAALDGVEVLTGRGAGLAGPGRVALAGGGEVAAAVVVDAAGRGQPLGAGPRPRTRRPGAAAEQTAYGVVVDEAVAAPLVGPGEALFMDWRPDHGEPGWPTFLYGVPLGGGAVLLEETSLARRPGLPLPVLRRRLPPAWPTTASPSRPTRAPRRCPSPSTAPATAPPACSASVQRPRSCTRPPATAWRARCPRPGRRRRAAAHLPQRPVAALAAARSAVWPPAARVVHRFRRIGLEALLRMPPEMVPEFFGVFFALPDTSRWSYLTGRADLPGTAAMGALFSHADVRLRRRLIDPAFRGPAPALPR